MRRKTPAHVEGTFRLRGKQHVTRVECFSDCVFGFAVTLLVASLEVPKSYGDLLVALRGLFAFALSFSILFSLWSRHHSFFRRYALEDSMTMTLTAFLLFTVLGYVYPLKFLAVLVVSAGIGLDRAAGRTMFTPGHEIEQVRGLFLLYGSGLFIMSIIFFAFYRYAYRQRRALELTPIETFDTVWFANEHLFQAAVPVIATVLAYVVPPDQVGFAGFSYCLYGVAGTWHGATFGRLRRQKLAELEGVT